MVLLVTGHVRECGVNCGPLPHRQLPPQRGVLGAACGARAAAPGPATGFDTRQRYKISYWHWGTQEYFDRERRAADKFQQKFPNVEVEVVLQATGFGDKITAAFAAGRVAIMARWTTGVGVYKRVTDFKWGMVPYPKRKTYANDYATSGPAIARDSKARAAAWELVKFRQGQEGGLEHATDGYAVFFQSEPKKRVQETHRSIPTLETPAAMFEMLEGGKHSFVRLLSVDQGKIHGQLINPELSKVWNNSEAAASVAKRIADSVNDFLKTNPQ